MSPGDWAAWVTAIGTVGALLALGLTALYAYRTVGVARATAASALDALNDARRTRHGLLVTDLSRRWDEDLIVRSQMLYANYTRASLVALMETLFDPARANERTDEHRANYFLLIATPNLIETIAVLHLEGAIDIGVVERMWGESISAFWKVWRGPIQRLRRLTESKDPYRNWQVLALALRRRSRGW